MLTEDNLVRLAPRESPAARLVCVPHAGAGAAAFKMWTEQVSDDVELIAVRLPGREHLFEQTPLTNMPAIGASLGALLAGMAGPVGLFGYCAGAFAAFEAARRMTGEHAPPAILAVCSQVAPHRNTPGPAIHALPSDRLKEALRAMGGTEPIVLEHEEFWEVTEPAVRADYEAAETYATRPEPRIPCDVLAFRGSGDAEVTAEDVGAWAEVTSGACATHHLDGGHFLLRTRAAEVLTEVERRLRALPATR
jgi:medium-chain acyl-[acyl-carrier-protein] hydrolase